ncbi:MAG: putative oxidoreductase [Bacillales bacterium]|nr:putative oxidoreductase [Bacillales bacterium]
MKKLKIGKSSLLGSEIILGCMRIANMQVNEVDKLVHTAMDNGINFYDHADIYGGGKSEQVFGQVLADNPGLREKIIVQSKCGIRPGFFDFSKEHILASVDQSLKNLQTDYLDALLLHRPDTLMEPEEVAEAFDELEKSGKVRHFGVSNQRPMTMELMKKAVKQVLMINQLQFSVTNTGMVDASLNVNMENEVSVVRDSQVLEYCRINDITIQAWSPLQYGFFEGVFVGNREKYPTLNEKLDKYAEKYGVTPTAVAIAWILRHPARMQAIVGTTNVERLNDICRSSEVVLSRQEWYEIYRSAGNVLP